MKKLPMSYYERRADTSKIMAVIDHMAEVLSRSEYRGNNPALKSIYSPMRCSMLMMMILFFVLFVLGGLVPIGSASIAKGTIVVLNNKRTVQHLEGGIIREILVKDGDKVKEGQPLIELNAVAQKASQTMVQAELYANRVTEARLLTLNKGGDHFDIPPVILDAAQKNNDLTNAIATQQNLFASQRDMVSGKLDTLTQHIKQYKEEIAGLETQVQSADRQLALIEQEAGPMAELVAKGYASMPQLIALQRQQEELKGSRGQYKASIAKARQSITETNLQIADVQNEYNTKNTEELRDVQTKIADLEEKLRSTTDVVSRSTITAPNEGIVTGLKYHTIGGVITPGAAIMDIVPQNERLVVDAQINPSDIDAVSVGMPTKIVLTSYKSREAPHLNGKLVNVSADVITQQQGAQTLTYYNARVEVNSDEFEQLAQSIKLYPGMQVEVFILTGSRSFMSYMFAPITNSLHKAFKED